MRRLRIISDLEECQALWERAIPRQVIYDLWEVRVCFQEHFARPSCFIVAEENGEIRGLLPLSWIEESETYGYFPGETWEGETWLEQNRIPAADRKIRQALLNSCPAPYHLRYLLLPDGDAARGQIVDELEYSFAPPNYEYDLENYLREFSRKSRKRLRNELESFETLGVQYRYNEVGDFEHIVRLNIDRFGDTSYFFDPRFTESFRSLTRFLEERGWLRLTTVLIGDEVAAVDLGCVFNGSYTLLAGGTNGDYRGVAKLINIHHMRWACQQRLELVDFLCGDFSWKTLFHLTPRPLYLLSNNTNATDQVLVGAGSGSETHAG